MIPCDQDNFYHVPKTVLDTPQVSIVVCERCKVERYFTKGRNERVDNEEYMAFHARNFIQPEHRHFEREFGKPRALKYNEEKVRESQRYNEGIEEQEKAAEYKSNLL